MHLDEKDKMHFQEPIKYFCTSVEVWNQYVNLQQLVHKPSHTSIRKITTYKYRYYDFVSEILNRFRLLKL